MKGVIAILGIVLPALIIILGIVRIFVTKTRGVNGLIMFFAILLLLIGLIRYFIYPDGKRAGHEAPKTPAITVSSHSVEFNRSLEKILNSYTKMTDGFVTGDSIVINRSARYLQLALDSLELDELKKDSLIYQTVLQPYSNAKTEIAAIILDPSVAEKRGSLNIFSNELQLLLSIVRYDQARLYWLECDKAFGEDKPGNWLSLSETVANPYGQADCGEIKSNINFVVADTTKKQ